MRKAVLLIAVLGLALALAGCRNITTDLHDIHVITLHSGEHAAIGNARIVTRETDVWGRLRDLPVPQMVMWIFYCRFEGDPPAWDYDMGWWRYAYGPSWDPAAWNPDAWNPDTNDYGDYGDYYYGLPRIHGWWEREEILDEYGMFYEWGGWVKRFHGQDYCEINGCHQWGTDYVPSPGVYDFVGWFTAGGTRITTQTVFDRDTTIHARWARAAEQPGSVARQIGLWHTGGLPPSVTLYVSESEMIRPQLLDFGGRPTTITLRGVPYTTCLPRYCSPCNCEPCFCRSHTSLTLLGPGAMFTVGNRVTLILEDVDLWGFDRNNISLIVVEDGGSLIIRDHALLAWNNTDSHRYGGAVTVNMGGTLRMEGGLIWQNLFRNPFIAGANVLGGGGGVWIRGGDFTMTGGLMYRNTALGGGGAVRISHGGSFTMTGGVLLENSSWAGGGVHVGGGSDIEWDPDGTLATGSTFILDGGDIIENWSPLWGGGVAIGNLGRFVMRGGEIFGNDGGDGAAIDNDEGGTVIIRGGRISFNTSVTGGAGAISNFSLVEMWDGWVAFNEGGSGGGVRNRGDFLMFGGNITNNIANGGIGGGVLNHGFFEMHGGGILHNYSNIQVGGILHGISGNAYVGQFRITNGVIWNNRDLTTHHPQGDPGSVGNLQRRNTNPQSFTTARFGFFSFNQTPAEYEWPVSSADRGGWTAVQGVAPVFNAGAARPAWYASGVIPTGWPTVDIWLHVPPAPVASDFPFRRGMAPWTVGRPRVDRGPGGDELVLNADLPIRNAAGLSQRGGVTFPSSVVTFAENLLIRPDSTGTPGAPERRPVVLDVRHGAILEMTGVNAPLNPFPTVPLLPLRPLAPNSPDVWPWLQNPSGAGESLPSPWYSPLRLNVVQETTAYERTLFADRPELLERFMQRTLEPPVLPEVPLPSLDEQLRRRAEMYVPRHLAQRMHDQVMAMFERSGEFSPTGR